MLRVTKLHTLLSSIKTLLSRTTFNRERSTDPIRLKRKFC